MKNRINRNCSLYDLVAWLVLRFGHSRQLLDWLGFASCGFEEVPMAWLMNISMTDQNVLISITAPLGQISTQLCSWSSNYCLTCCKVSEISLYPIDLMYKLSQWVQGWSMELSKYSSMSELLVGNCAAHWEARIIEEVALFWKKVECAVWSGILQFWHTTVVGHDPVRAMLAITTIYWP